MIRLMTIDDYQEVYDLWLSNKGMALNDIDDSYEGIKRFLDRNPTSCFVAVKDELIIGVILCGNDGRRGYIYHLVVHPLYRRQNVATKLVNKALESLYELSITKVALLVFKNNKDANLFWNNQGFIERNDIFYRNKNIVELVRYDS